MKLIHYGSDNFEKMLFRKIKNAGWVKPDGGLWTSPINSCHGWVDWCQGEQFRLELLEQWFLLELKPEARVLKIDCLDDLVDAPSIEANWIGDIVLDFEEIAKDYDAIWLTVKGQAETRMTRPHNLYGWDCESVLILNVDCVIEIENDIKIEIVKQA